MRSEESKKIDWPNVGKVVYTDQHTFIIPKRSSRYRYRDHDDEQRPSGREKPRAWKVQSETQRHLVLVSLKPDRGAGICETKVIEKDSTSELAKLFDSERDVWIARIDEAQDALAGAANSVKDERKSLDKAQANLKKAVAELAKCKKLGGVAP